MLYALSLLGVPAGLAGARTAGGETAILMYHGTPRRQAADLERQFAYLSRCFDVVPLAALREAPRAGRRRVVLTFDDGLRNNLTVAYPLLRRFALPATVFVCPGLIGTGSWLWNHEARERLRSLPAAALGRLARDVGAPAEVERFVDCMKRMPLLSRRRAEKAVREATPGFGPSASQREAFDLAGWDELRALDPRIVTLGSHTMSHSILTSLDAASIEHELAESRRAIERETGREAAYFCYPNGDYDDVALAAARRHYDGAVTTGFGSVPAACDSHQLPRMTEPGPGLRGMLRLARRLSA